MECLHNQNGIRDYTNKKQLKILVSVIGVITVLLIVYINKRPQIQRLEKLPIIMEYMIANNEKQDSTLYSIYSMVLELKTELNHFPSTPLSIQDLSQVTSQYKMRIDPVTGAKEFHTGIDYMAKEGTDVYAAAAGVVIEAKWDGGYGNTIEIDHGNKYITHYAHLSTMDVSVGKVVKKGDLIGLVGRTGKTTGSHLHYEVLYADNGHIKKLNPKYFTDTAIDTANHLHNP